MKLTKEHIGKKVAIGSKDKYIIPEYISKDNSLIVGIEYDGEQKFTKCYYNTNDWMILQEESVIHEDQGDIREKGKQVDVYCDGESWHIKNNTEESSIPKSQSWVVPGKKYINEKSKCEYYIPQKFLNNSNKWYGSWHTIEPNELCNEGWLLFSMINKQEWIEYKEPKKTIRMAPAFIKNGDPLSPYCFISTALFSSKKDACHYYSTLYENIDERLGTLHKYKVIKWPANENLWVEVEVE